MAGKVFIFICLFLCAFLQDPYKIALEKQLNLVKKSLTTTLKGNDVIVYGITAMLKKQFTQLQGKPGVIINSLMHPREKSAYSMLKAVTQELINQYRSDPQITYVLDNGVVWFLPYTNIDGVLFHEEPNNQKLEVRKNMNHQNGKKCKKTIDKGVDINRNFDYNYGTINTSKNPCSVEYRGEKAFSEPQSQAIEHIFNHSNITVAIDIHSYGDVWIYPYASHQSNDFIKKHPLYPRYQDIFEMFEQKGIEHSGCYQSLGYIADGVYIDWALSKNAISFAYEVGKDFDDDAADQITQNVPIFMNIIKYNSPLYKLYKNNDQNEICIVSHSLLQFEYWLGVSGSFKGVYEKLAPSANLCHPYTNQSYEIYIKGIKGKTSVNGEELSTKTFNQPQEGNSWLWLLVKLTILFYVGGMCCGMTVCLERCLGKKIFPSYNQERQKLSAEEMMQQTNS